MSVQHDDEQQSPTETRLVRPTLPPQAMQLINAVISTSEDLTQIALARRLRKIHSDWQDEAWSVELRAVALVIADLLDQAWGVSAVGDTIELRPPGLLIDGETVEGAKQRIRDALRVARARQLDEVGVRTFLKKMHRPVRRAPGVSSISDLIDSGAELSAQIRAALGLPRDQLQIALSEIIRPVIQVCDEDTRCEATGIRLIDIWRYFRHTWSLEYRPIPGRQTAFLVRNAARPRRPVMGIAMLASPIVRLRARDNWIGWTPESVAQAIKLGHLDPREVLESLSYRIDASILEIRTDDIVTTDELANPTENVVLRLEQRAEGAARVRRRVLETIYAETQATNDPVRPQRDPARNSVNELDYRALSEDPLFVHKRADTLSRLLDAKLVFVESRCLSTNADPLRRLFGHPRGERALSVALQEVRKAGLSSQVADLSVCGAVAPYNVLLGGKLVALLVAAEETISAYRKKYSERASVISSQMAGRPIFRPAELKILTTTSLYGNGSSQYNRLRLQKKQFSALKADISWCELERTMGYGTYHLAPITIRVLREVAQRAYGARRINNRFGEGASPRLRQTREGLDALGIESTAILHHATPRLFYGCELESDARHQLMGLRPIARTSGSSIEEISDAWRARWLTNRIMQTGILERVARLGPESIKVDLQVPDDTGQLGLGLEPIGA